MISNLVANNKQYSFSEFAYNKTNIDYAEYLLKQFNIIEFKNRKVGLLAQGARKVLDIVDRYFRKPSIVLLDEPTSGISSDEKYSVMDHTLTAIRNLNIAILFIEHDMDIIRRYSKKSTSFL